MAVVYQESVGDGWLVLWRIAETAEELARLVTIEELEAAQRLGNLSRRRQWLAWRAALHGILPDVRTGYRKSGAPILKPTAGEKEGSSGFIGVSHTHDLATVIFSPGEPCAVDIERLDRNFDRVSSRYISNSEMQLPCSREAWFPVALWCAKETLYKQAGMEGVDFRDDIRIETIDCKPDMENDAPQGRITGRIRGHRSVPLRFFTFDGHLVVHTVAR